MFLQLAQIADNAAFIAAAISMGWDETNYKEILDDLSQEEGFIVNMEVCKKTLSNVAIEEAEVYTTIGDECGNRWFNNPCAVFKDEDGNFWAREKDIESFC